MQKAARAVVHTENQDSSLVVDMDMMLQGHKNRASDNDHTSKVVEAVDYNGVGKRAVEDAAAVGGIKSLVLEPQLQPWLGIR